MYCDHLGNKLEEFDAAKPVQRRAYEAYLKGYRVSDAGTLYGLHGKAMVLYKSGRYPAFQIHLEREQAKMRAHKFAAYCFFGFAAFDEDVIYLSDDLFDISRRNIALRPAVKLTHEQMQRVNSFYSRVRGKRAAKGAAQALADELGVSLSTVMRARTRLVSLSAKR
jgi:hypothetical protein